MRSFFDWMRSDRALSDRPWVILGKGPSFALRDAYDLRAYHALSLNHAVRELPVVVAHAIDLDVVTACADVIPANARFLVMPFVPHVNNRPSDRKLDVLAREVPILRRMDEEGRLLFYNLRAPTIWDEMGWGSRKPGDPEAVPVRYFSVEAALNLLAMAGVRCVRSLGIDGGTSYAGAFSDLRDKTLLNNGHQSFDKQFQQIARTLMATGVDYSPLNVESPIRVYVGSSEPQDLAVKVLEYSIKKHTSMSVDVFPLHRAAIDIPMPRDPANKPRTPFSFQRLLIPQLAGFHGRAVYLDSDMQVFRDMRELWTLPFGGADLLAAREPGDTGRKPQFSVMLLDCERLQWKVEEIVAAMDKGDLTYEALMYDMAIAKDIRADIDPSWNSLERYKEAETSLLHYTDMTTQPWIYRDHPLGYLWTTDLFEAVDANFIDNEYVRQHVERGYVRPSLMHQLEHRIADARLLPKAVSALDADFSPPYQSIAGVRAPTARDPVGYLKAAVRHYLAKPPLPYVARAVRRRLGL